VIPAQGIAYYEKALAVRQGAIAALNDLGLVLYEKYWLDDNAKGWGAGAITVFRRALRIDPKFAPALGNLGRALQAKGNWPEAMDADREALRLDPRLAPTHVSLGECWRAQRAQRSDGPLPAGVASIRTMP
jgi:tetratricopeptide (TPR) repeat protein